MAVHPLNLVGPVDSERRLRGDWTVVPPDTATVSFSVTVTVTLAVARGHLLGPLQQPLPSLCITLDYFTPDHGFSEGD